MDDDDKQKYFDASKVGGYLCNSVGTFCAAPEPVNVIQKCSECMCMIALL